MKDPANWATVALALSPDGASVGAVGVELTNGQKPLNMFLLERIDVGKDPLYRRVADWLDRSGGDPRVFPLYLPASRDRRRLVVDTSEYLRGRLLGRAVLHSPARRRWTPRLTCIEMVGSDIPNPEKRGEYLAVARREVLGSAMQAIAAGLLEFSHGAQATAVELRSQMTRMDERRSKDDAEATGGDLALSAVLAIWDVMSRLERRDRADWKTVMA